MSGRDTRFIFAASPSSLDYLTGQYVHTGIGQFTEHDGSGFDINVGSQSIPSFTASAGIEAAASLPAALRRDRAVYLR